MGIFSNRFERGKQLENISFRFYLADLLEKMEKGDYSSLGEFVNDFEYNKDLGELLPMINRDLRRHGNYCSFRGVVSKVFGDVATTIDVLRNAVDGDEEARQRSVEFFSLLAERLEGIAA